MAKNPARKHTEPKTDRTPQILTGIWAVLMLSLFPLIFTDFYFNILETKFITLCILNFGVMGGILLWRLFTYYVSIIIGAVVVTTEKDSQRLLDYKKMPEWLQKRMFMIPIAVDFIDEREKGIFNSALMSALKAFPQGYE